MKRRTNLYDLGKFPSRLRQLRLDRQATQVEFANSVGLSDSRYGHYETGRHNPPLDVLLRLANEWNFDLNEVFL